MTREPAGRGRFLVLEGPDGGGKSTQALQLVAWLGEQGRDTVHIRDPGGTRVGERIRGILLDPAHVEIAPLTEMLLYMASRAQLAEEVIRPALARGDVVVCERWIPSTACYQGHAGGLDPETVWAVGEIAVPGLVPDLTLVLDVDPEEGLRRLSGDPDLMERRSLAYHRRVREGYRSVVRDGRMGAVLIPSGSVEEVAMRIRESVVRVL